MTIIIIIREVFNQGSVCLVFYCITFLGRHEKDINLIWPQHLMNLYFVLFLFVFLSRHYVFPTFLHDKLSIGVNMSGNGHNIYVSCDWLAISPRCTPALARSGR